MTRIQTLEEALKDIKRLASPFADEQNVAGDIVKKAEKALQEQSLGAS